MSSPPYNLARSLSDSLTTRSPIVFSVIDFTFRVKMPALFNPKDSEERDLWMKACVAQPGEVVDGFSKAQKSKIRSRFYVVGGKLMDKILWDEKGIERSVFIDSDFNALWEKNVLNDNFSVFFCV